MSASLQNVLLDSAAPDNAQSQISEPFSSFLAGRGLGEVWRGSACVEKGVWLPFPQELGGLVLVFSEFRLRQLWGPSAAFGFPYKHPSLKFLASGPYRGQVSIPSTDMVLQSISRPERGQEEACQPPTADHLLRPTLQPRPTGFSRLPATPALVPQETGNLIPPDASLRSQVQRPPGFSRVWCTEGLSQETTIVPGFAHKAGQGPALRFPETSLAAFNTKPPSEVSTQSRADRFLLLPSPLSPFSLLPTSLLPIAPWGRKEWDIHLLPSVIWQSN